MPSGNLIMANSVILTGFRASRDQKDAKIGMITGSL